MESGFSYGDIIVIGAIAAFILLRYRAMLGTSNDNDAAPRTKPAPVSEYERVIQLPAARITVSSLPRASPPRASATWTSVPATASPRCPRSGRPPCWVS